jgi:hypothetical protein
MQKPQWIPIAIGLPPILWKDSSYDLAELEELLLLHKKLFLV